MAEDMRMNLEERLWRFAQDEPTIWAYLKMYQRTSDPLILTLEKIVYALAKDKKQIQDQCKTLIDTRTNPILIDPKHISLD